MFSQPEGSPPRKLIRVSHHLEKKLVVAPGALEDFAKEVAKKFNLPDGEPFFFTDSEGAEIDAETYPLLCQLVDIPSVTFRRPGDPDQVLLELTLPAGSNDFQTVSAVPRVVAGNSERQVFSQVLNAYFEEKEDLKLLLQEIKSSKFVSNPTAQVLSREAVTKLIELKGEEPSSASQRNLALALVDIIPEWKFPDSETGIDVLFDEVNRAGLIQAKLRQIHRNLQKANKRKRPTEKLPLTGGPKTKAVSLPDAEEEVPAELAKFASAGPHTSPQEIKALLLCLLPHRNQIRGAGSTKFLQLYPKFKELPYLINLEFELLQGETIANNFLSKWPDTSSQILDNCKKISKSNTLKNLLSKEYGDWDRDFLALFCLLHLIPPAPQGRGKATRVKTNVAQSHILQYFKEGTPIPSILENWDKAISQPCLVSLGPDSLHLSQFFISLDGALLPLNASSSAEAIDCLFKSHYVFGTQYDPNLIGLWKFIQVYLYQLEKETTHIPTKVKQVFLQLHPVPQQ